MRDWNFFDTAIYSHFNTTFWKKIEAFKNFDEDMKILEEKLEQIKKTCLAGEKICPPNDSKCQFNPGSGIKLKAYEVCETFNMVFNIQIIFSSQKLAKRSRFAIIWQCLQWVLVKKYSRSNGLDGRNFTKQTFHKFVFRIKFVPKWEKNNEYISVTREFFFKSRCNKQVNICNNQSLSKGQNWPHVPRRLNL